ncbi:zinc finger protein 783 isoform X11 [Macaca fascicularis]|uniref:zinc finger protein 783 isoform X11 n=1 Tax=Macaca fascicularis TaxID=9541 RepID=UPI003D1586A8
MRGGAHPVAIRWAWGTASSRTRSPCVPSPGGPAISVRAGKAGLTPSAERTVQPGLCGAARKGSGDSLPRQASTGPWPRRLRLRTGICRLTSREKPRSDLQRSPFWLSWLLFRWWRRRWNPRLPGYRAWRDAHGQLADCEKVAVKFGNQTVAQAGGQVGHVGDSAVGVRAAAEAAGERAVQQKLLDPVAAPRQQGGGLQGNLYFQVPMTPEDTVGYFSEQQGGGLEDSQKELYKRVVKGSCETLSSLDAGQLETPQEFRPGSSKRQEQVGGASRAHRRPLWHTCAQRPV